MVELQRGKGVIKLITKEQVAHELAVAVAQAYVVDETKRGEYRESGVEGAALDAFNAYTRAYNTIVKAE